MISRIISTIIRLGILMTEEGRAVHGGLGRLNRFKRERKRTLPPLASLE
jgi:hypothetical protein